MSTPSARTAASTWTAPPTSEPSARLAAIADARKAVLRDQSALPTNSLAPWILRSWQRCLSRGLQAHQPVCFDSVSQAHMRRTAEANQQLVQTAKPMLERLALAIVNTRYFAILTNAHGMVVDVAGAIDRSDPRAQLITRIGVDLSEPCVGTSAISAALSEGQPVWLHRGEHFFDATAVYSCAGAPLMGPDGRCVGMLDVTGIEALERPELKHLVTQSAGKIENALLLAQNHTLLVRLGWPGSPLGTDADGMVCLDSDGWITGANSVARQMLAALTTPQAQSVHVSEVFGVPYQVFFDALRRPEPVLEVPLWSGLRLLAIPIARERETLPVQAYLGLGGAPGLSLKKLEAALIRRTVEQAHGNVAQAARSLGLSRATVYRKLNQSAY